MSNFTNKSGKTDFGLVDPTQIIRPGANRTGGIVPQSIQLESKDRTASARTTDPKVLNLPAPPTTPQKRHAVTGRFVKK
jgi:hypothetical protein